MSAAQHFRSYRRSTPVPTEIARQSSACTERMGNYRRPADLRPVRQSKPRTRK